MQGFAALGQPRQVNFRYFFISCRCPTSRRPPQLSLQATIRPLESSTRNSTAGRIRLLQPSSGILLLWLTWLFNTAAQARVAGTRIRPFPNYDSSITHGSLGLRLNRMQWAPVGLRQIMCTGGAYSFPQAEPNAGCRTAFSSVWSASTWAKHRDQYLVRITVHCPVTLH